MSAPHLVRDGHGTVPATNRTCTTLSQHLEKKALACRLKVSFEPHVDHENHHSKSPSHHISSTADLFLITNYCNNPTQYHSQSTPDWSNRESGLEHVQKEGSHHLLRDSRRCRGPDDELNRIETNYWKFHHSRTLAR